MTGLAPGLPVRREIFPQIGIFSSATPKARSPTKRGRPIAPTAGNVSSVLAAIRSGGCGTWYGRGVTAAFWKR